MMQHLRPIFHNSAQSGLAALVLAAALICGPVRAQPDIGAAGPSGAWQKTDETAARLIAGQRGLSSDGRIWLGVQIKLAPGWKTYWRNPGESGAPTRLNWDASRNVETVEVRWPVPQRFHAFGFDSFGYHDEVVLPVLLKATEPSQPARARLSLEYLVCGRVCIPNQAELALDLPAAGAKAKAGGFAPLIRRYLDLVPQPAAKIGLNIDSAAVSGPPGKQILLITGNSRTPFTAPDVMVEGPEPFGFGRPKVAYGDGRRDVTLALPVYAGIGKAKLATQTLTLTMVDGRRAVERRITLGQ